MKPLGPGVQLIAQALAEHEPVRAVFALFSGGHDSLASTAIAAEHWRFTAAVHINTGIGIPQTREFVRDTCASQGWPLIELNSTASYERLVLDRGGFPSGPRSHNAMYWYLKQRPLSALIQRTKHNRGDRVALVTGIRLDESVRRMNAGISVPIRRNRSSVWVNPILDWSATDCGAFIEAQGLERNPVVDLLHRSGECLCGALARPGEIIDIDLWFPQVGGRIHALEAEARARGLRNTKWADRRAWGTAEQLTLELCASCAVPSGHGRLDTMGRG